MKFIFETLFSLIMVINLVAFISGFLAVSMRPDIECKMTIRRELLIPLLNAGCHTGRFLSKDL
jgi:hypothetical protein